MITSALLFLALGQVGCGKDTDCKGARICELGKCVSPQPHRGQELVADAGEPAVALNPNDFPRIVRRDNVVCMQELQGDGGIVESCRSDVFGPKGREAIRTYKVKP